MEPVAPGTEEDNAINNFPSSTKQEKEKERLLSIRRTLPNGRFGNVFDLSYINGAEHWYCNACACPVMGWIFHHEQGKRHKTAIGNTNTFDTNSGGNEQGDAALHVVPGQPLPPGFEGEAVTKDKLSIIQERLDAFTVGPLVALEYLLELKDYDVSKEPAYLCVLCDKKGDPRTVLTHLASYKHIVQYIQKHFPTCYRALAPYMVKQYKRNWQQTLHEVAEAIEKRFGRLKPTPVDADKFYKDQMLYIKTISNGRHFSEKMGYTFEEYINKSELTKIHDDESASNSGVGTSSKKKSPSPPVVQNPIKKLKLSLQTTSGGTGEGRPRARSRSLSSMSSITSSELSDFDDKPNNDRKSGDRSSPNRNHNRDSQYLRRSPYQKRSPIIRDDRGDSRDKERHLMPWEKSNYQRSKYIIDNRNQMKSDKLLEFQRLAKAIDTDMDRILIQHKSNPEKHAQYNEEWKTFWNRRYKELQTESKDVSNYDFKPEWIEFWNKRILELHNEEVKAKKDALRRRLGLPDEPAPISFKIELKKKSGPNSKETTRVVHTNKPSPIAAQPDNDPEVIIIDDKDDDGSSQRSQSPWKDSRKKYLHGNRSHNRSSPHRYTTNRDRGPSYKSRSRSKSRDRVAHVRPRHSHEKQRQRYSRSRSPEYRSERIRVVSELPWERHENWRYHRSAEYSDYYKPPTMLRDVTREPVGTSSIPQMVEECDTNADVNVVSVLRLLTALEDKLGSLGPRVVDLLAQALAMEKNEANSSEQLIENEGNCVLFETVKEKLKGILHAGLVDMAQERAFKTAIRRIASLIHFAGELTKNKEDKRHSNTDPVRVSGIGAVDKSSIARQIANALVLQGKTDVSQAELEQLINAVVGMAETSRQINKPLSFSEQMSKMSTVAPSTDDHTNSSVNIHGLSDSDLQTLLQNFKDLSTEEQHGLIGYLKTLEAKEPERVERLRKFVNLGCSNKEEEARGRASPFSNRLSSINPPPDENSKSDDDQQQQSEKMTNISESKTMSLSDDDEDEYSIEDIYKAASRTVKQRELEKKRKIVEDTMKFDSLKGKDQQRALNIAEKSTTKSSDQGTFSTSGLSATNMDMLNSPDFANTLMNIPVNISNLASIMGNVQNMAQNMPSGGTPSQLQTSHIQTTRYESGNWTQQPNTFTHQTGPHVPQQQFNPYGGTNPQTVSYPIGRNIYNDPGHFSGPQNVQGFDLGRYQNRGVEQFNSQQSQSFPTSETPPARSAYSRW